MPFTVTHIPMQFTVPVRVDVNWVNSRGAVIGISSMATSISGGCSTKPLRDSSSDTTAWRTTQLMITPSPTTMADLDVIYIIHFARCISVNMCCAEVTGIRGRKTAI